MRCRSEAQSGSYGGSDYRWVADWQSVQSGLITCWNIWIDKASLYYSIMRAQDLSIYRRAVRTKDGRLAPETVLGDSVMSGRHLRSVISRRPLF